MGKSNLSQLKQRARGISLGLYAADLGDLSGEARTAIGWGCGILHFDEMDGVFVPGFVGGSGFVKALGSGPLLDVHLMLQNPAAHVAGYVAAGADIICVHAESDEPGLAIGNIRAAAKDAGRDVLAGLALMPGTELEDVSELLALKPDMILVLSLDPRVNAPPDIGRACRRIKTLRALAPDAVLAFDGGVTLQTIKEIKTCEPDIIVSGSAVFKADNPAQAYAQMAQT